MRQPNIDYSDLQKLGLSKTAIACYKTLYEDGAITIGELAMYLRVNRTNLYRVLKNLEELGFITMGRSDIAPTYCFAVPLRVAIESYIEHQRRSVSSLVKQQLRLYHR